MNENRVAIVAGARTPFVKAGQAFAKLGPLALATHAVRGLVERHHVDPASIESIAFGTVVPERGKPNLAREVVFEAGLPASIEAQTVSSYCITGLRTATIIADAIARGRIEAGIAGGVEWLSGADPATLHPAEGLLMAPAITIPRLLTRAGVKLADIDLLELHEAFAGQVLANIAALERGWKSPSIGKADWSRINVNGSSIAVGHPWSA